MIKILIAEDEKALRELAVIRLKREGFEVFEAANGEIAYELCLSEKPDVLLLDILMPIMDGYKVARAIRSNAKIKDMIIIAVSAKAELVDKRNAIEAGVDIYLNKPITYDEVIDTINKAIENKSKG